MSSNPNTLSDGVKLPAKDFGALRGSLVISQWQSQEAKCMFEQTILPGCVDLGLTDGEKVVYVDFDVDVTEESLDSERNDARQSAPNGRTQSTMGLVGGCVLLTRIDVFAKCELCDVCLTHSRSISVQMACDSIGHRNR